MWYAYSFARPVGNIHLRKEKVGRLKKHRATPSGVALILLYISLLHRDKLDARGAAVDVGLALDPEAFTVSDRVEEDVAFQ